MGTSAGQAGQRGAAPQGREEPRPPQGYAVPSPHQGLENHPALWYDGINSVVTPIVKTNFLISTVAARVFLHEKIGKKGVLGFVAVSIGVLMFLI